MTEIIGTMPVKLVDANGQTAEFVEDIDGTYHLAASVNQKIVKCDNNSSTTNLTSSNSYTFTGQSCETYGAAGIQLFLKTDKNATLYIDQSSDSINWDVTDSYNYYYSFGGTSYTVQTVAAYFRVRVILTGTADTTYFRLHSNLVPTIEALPRSLSHSGRLKTENQIEDSQVERYAAVSPLGELEVAGLVRLVGKSFSGTTKDTNFFTETVTGSGSVSQAGQITLSTGATANSTAKYKSVKKGRKAPGSSMQFRAIARFTTAGTTNNLRRIGIYDGYEGYFYQLDGSTFSVGYLSSGTPNLISSGSFNGNLGATFSVSTNAHRLVIIYTELSVEFYIDGVLLHTIRSMTDPLTTTLTFPITFDNINSNGLASNILFSIRFTTISRLGELTTAHEYKYISTNSTNVLKRSAGHLESVINVDNAGSITIYDEVSAVPGTEICVIDASKVLGAISFSTDFSIGLTVVTALGAKCTVIYE